MTILYPRLVAQTGRELLDGYRGKTIDEVASGAGTHHPAAYYAATGGEPARDGHLRELAEAIRQRAKDYGYPTSAGDAARTAFDHELAIVLHEIMDLVPAEAACEGMWTFMACRLVPDVVLWRFGTDNAERWLGRGLVRHALGRLWWQAHTLGIERNDTWEYSLLPAFSESDLNQVFERRAIGGVPPLVRALARSLSEPDVRKSSVARRDLVRDVTKRLLRLLPFTSFMAMDSDDLRTRVDAVVTESMSALGAPRYVVSAETSIGEEAIRFGTEGGQRPDRVNGMSAGAKPPQSQVGAAHSGLGPYRPYEGQGFGDPRDLNTQHRVNAIIAVVAEEGPVKAQRVYRLITQLAGTRLREYATGLLVEATKDAVRSGRLAAENQRGRIGYLGATLRMPEHPVCVLRERGPRDLDDIPERELVAAAAFVQLQEPINDFNELARLVSRLYGYAKTTVQFREALGDALSRHKS